MTIRCAVAAAFLILFAGVLAMAQQPPSNMPDMMKMHEQMMAEMKANDAKLEALVKDMNAASGTGKVNAIAATVTELVRQHQAMHARMGQMHEQMMGMGGMMGRRGMMRGQ